jgi:hypothetical protein
MTAAAYVSGYQAGIQCMMAQWIDWAVQASIAAWIWGPTVERSRPKVRYEPAGRTLQKKFNVAQKRLNEKRKRRRGGVIFRHPVKLAPGVELLYPNDPAKPRLTEEDLETHEERQERIINEGYQEIFERVEKRRAERDQWQEVTRVDK